MTDSVPEDLKFVVFIRYAGHQCVAMESIYFQDEKLAEAFTAALKVQGSSAVTLISRIRQ